MRKRSLTGRHDRCLRSILNIGIERNWTLGPSANEALALSYVAVKRVLPSNTLEAPRNVPGIAGTRYPEAVCNRDGQRHIQRSLEAGHAEIEDADCTLPAYVALRPRATESTSLSLQRARMHGTEPIFSKVSFVARQAW